MICKNCGATLQDDVPICPYCGTDNFQNSLREHQDTVNDFRKKIFFWRNLPDRVAKKGQRLVVIGLIVFFILAIVVGVVGVIAGKVESKRTYEKEMVAVEELEKLYLEKDYDGVAETYREYELGYGSKFAKYDEVEQMNYYYHQAKDSMEEDIRQAKELQDDICMYTQVDWFQLLRCCDEFEKAGYLYEEEEAVLYYRQEAISALRDEMHLSEAGIQAILEEYIQIEDYDQKEKYEEKLRGLLYDSVMQGEQKLSLIHI